MTNSYSKHYDHMFEKLFSINLYMCASFHYIESANKHLDRLEISKPKGDE